MSKDIMELLLEAISEGKSEDGKKERLTPVAELTMGEHAEHKSILQVAENLRLEAEELSRRRLILEQRSKAWWYMVRENHDLHRVDHIKIEGSTIMEVVGE